MLTFFAQSVFFKIALPQAAQQSIHFYLEIFEETVPVLQLHEGPD